MVGLENAFMMGFGDSPRSMMKVCRGRGWSRDVVDVVEVTCGALTCGFALPSSCWPPAAWCAANGDVRRGRRSGGSEPLPLMMLAVVGVSAENVSMFPGGCACADGEWVA